MEYRQSRWEVEIKLKPRKGCNTWLCGGDRTEGWYMTDGFVAIHGGLYGLGTVVTSEG